MRDLHVLNQHAGKRARTSVLEVGKRPKCTIPFSVPLCFLLPRSLPPSRTPAPPLSLAPLILSSLPPSRSPTHPTTYQEHTHTHKLHLGLADDLLVAEGVVLVLRKVEDVHLRRYTNTHTKYEEDCRAPVELVCI